MVLETPMPTGAVRSRHDPRDFDFHRSELYAGAVPVPVRDYDFRHLHTWRVQGAPSCVAYSLIAKVQALAVAQGKALPELCAELNWWGARNLDAPPGIAMVGSSCRLNIKYARDIGLKLETDFPDALENHNRVPPARVLEASPVVRVTRYHRIKGEGNPDVLRDGILTAFSLLDAGGQCSFPGAVIEVGDGYASVLPGDTWDGTVGRSWGTHDQAIGLYRQSDDSIGFLSSWGEQRVWWVPIPVLAAKGFEFWIVDQLEYIE